MSSLCFNVNSDELIHRATRQGRIFSLEAYLNKNPTFDINRKFEYGRSKWTLLITACYYKHENIVRLLLRRFNPDINGTGDVKLDFVNEVMHGVSALWVAAAVGHLDIVKLLVEQGKANVNHLSFTRSSALRAASYIGRIDIAKYLIEHGADMKLVRTGNYTNLMLSAYRQHENLVEYFLTELKCDPNECDQDGRRPLHYAIDGGSIEVVNTLLKHGAENSPSDSIPPIFWAALEAKPEFVQVFENRCASIDQWIEAQELVGASFANTELKNYNLKKSVEYISFGFQLRLIHNLPKRISSLPAKEAFNFEQECLTLEQFQCAASESNFRLHLEALMILERILGERNKRYRRALRYYGAVLADLHQYQASISLWLYELDLRKKGDKSLDKWHLREFVRMFAEIRINTNEPVSAKALLILLETLRNEIERTHHHDHCLISLFYLVTVIAHLSDEQKRSHQMKEVYTCLKSIVRSQYRTVDDDRSLTLLHMSALIGRGNLNDRCIMLLCRKPSIKTFHLLLAFGADVDAPDSDLNTSLHLIAQRTEDPENVKSIIDLLCNSAGAHPDFINRQKKIPVQCTLDPFVQQSLRLKYPVNCLKCLCAKFIRDNNLSSSLFHCSTTMRDFVARH